MTRWWRNLKLGGKLGAVGWALFVLWAVWDAISGAL
jgi:hypothetical protein